MDDHFEFPRGIFNTLTLTNAAEDVGTASVPQRICWVRIYGGAAAEVVIFRSSDAATEYFRISVAITTQVWLPNMKFYCSGGLEVITLTAAGDVEVQIGYVDPTVGPGTLTGSWAKP